MENLAGQDGEIYLVKRFYASVDADRIFIRLLNDLAWQEEQIVIVGKRVKVPRLMCWYGDSEAVYQYSGVIHQPLSWTDDLLEIRRQLEQFCQHSFNSVLANQYRDGNDSMGWHADKEKELGINPYIASLNLGDERMFRIRHNKTKTTLNLNLQHGDLLLMGGALQHHWRHCVPKTAKEKKPRINLTLRRIYPEKRSRLLHL
jgi:alkylated DNA repair dioxygenase AlkB